MEREELLKRIAPCSLMCHTCSGYEDGVICKKSRELLHSLREIKEFYQKHLPDKAEIYSSFEGVLAEFGNGKCGGCRDAEHNTCSIEGCFILECTREKGIDFCGECKEFPCEKTKPLFEDEVYKQWLNGGTLIKEKGIVEFWSENCEKPHYDAYKE